MKIPISLLSVLAISAAASAQTNFKSAVSTLSNYGNYAVQGAAAGFQTVLAHTPVPKNKTLSVGAGTSAGGVDTIVHWNHWRGDVITLDVSEQGAVAVSQNQQRFVGGSTNSATPRSAVGGPHSLLLSIGGTPGARGLIEMWVSGVIDRGVGVEYSFDIGNDGRPEFDVSPPKFATKIVAVTIPRSGRLVIKVASAVKVHQAPGGGLRYKTGASLRFTPAPHCAILPYGDSCGPRLSGKYTPGARLNKFDLNITNGTARAPGVLVFGSHEIRVPLPGTTCHLLTNPRVVVPFRFDASGNRYWTFLLAPGLNIDVKLQSADLARNQLRPSNGLKVRCLR